MKIAELLCALSEGQVRYALVGGIAVQLHGYMRSTFDMDLVLAMDDENLVRFIGVAKHFGLVPSIPVSIESLRSSSQIEQWHHEKGMLAFSLREPQVGGGVVDILVRPEGPFEQLMENAVAGKLFGQNVWIAAIDDLLAMKRIADRPKAGSTSKHCKKSNGARIQMREYGQRARQIIPEETMLIRLAQSEQMREFFIQVWMQNPGLATQGGIKVRALMTSLEDDASQALPQKLSMTERTRQRGISLIELIMFIVIVGAALAGLLLVMNVTEKGSSDPLIRKQALAVAQSLLEEIELQDFNPATGAISPNPVTPANRATQYHVVRDYAGFTTAGIYTVDNIPITGLGGYNIQSVTVTNAALGSITSASGNAVLITVTVTDPQGNSMQVSGYRTAY